MHNKACARARRRVAASALLALAAAGLAGAAALSCSLAPPLLGQSVPAPAKAQEGPTAAEILAQAIKRQGVPKGVDPAAPSPLVLFAKTNLQFRPSLVRRSRHLRRSAPSPRRQFALEQAM